MGGSIYQHFFKLIIFFIGFRQEQSVWDQAQHWFSDWLPTSNSEQSMHQTTQDTVRPHPVNTDRVGDQDHRVHSNPEPRLSI